MPATLEEFPVLEPLLRDLAQARATVDKYSSFRGDRNAFDGRQNTIYREKAKEVEAGVVSELCIEIDGIDDAALGQPQKAIAKTVFDHGWWRLDDEGRKVVQDGWAIYERVEAAAEANRGIVARVTSKTIGLYESQGAADLLVTNPYSHKHHRHIVFSLPGHVIDIPNLDDNGFPDLKPNKDTHKREVVTGQSFIDKPWLGMQEFDPAREGFRQPFIRLGTPAQPGESLDQRLTTDEQRFAARLLIASLGHQNWLQVRAPGDVVQAKVTDEVANIYRDLLVGDTPADALPHIFYGPRSGLPINPPLRLRSRSLGSYAPGERTALLYAAGISASDVEAATRDKLAAMEATGTARGIALALRAKPVTDAFFERLVSL